MTIGLSSKFSKVPTARGLEGTTDDVKPVVSAVDVLGGVVEIDAGVGPGETGDSEDMFSILSEA